MIENAGKLWFFAAFVTAFVVFVVLLMIAGAQAQPRVSWTYVSCYTNSCIKATLDGLSADRAHDAKLTSWRDTTYVWYREQAER